jgi:hypothetical protein
MGTRPIQLVRSQHAFKLSPALPQDEIAIVLKSDADDLLRNGFGLAHERTDKARGYDQTQRDGGEFYSVTLSI